VAFLPQIGESDTHMQAQPCILNQNPVKLLAGIAVLEIYRHKQYNMASA